MMIDNKDSGSSPTTVHKCNWRCLGPLTFHGQVVGSKIRLSQGGRLAERNEDTFRDGLVFSNRPVKPDERIRFRVHSCVSRWMGAVRVGFTNVPPSSRSQPLPGMAIPDLTGDSSHWAAPVDESLCPTGSVLEFWVSSSGKILCAVNNKVFNLLSGVDVSKPLWAMIDVYGQTSSICLLGSEKKGWFRHKTSCPAPDALTIPYTSFRPDHIDLENGDDSVSCLNLEIPSESCCVVCMVRESTFTLPCGHRCLCHHCTSRVLEQFGFCPLCRKEIIVSS
ncbi:E3 ubiquitin-protein ligase NEURL3 [Austrofundulus limnaeus]|uniref:E3 ubiquitin-protein ligase NEURL3 n=1 Tax=Austrofundulus limnaeus TaxID=52670 RepID=A0A2I4BII3_AUSLI|nr:PREDICTED: E3 ubiquitin-protein ligase NEURL3-like [Austrofundulus limnaeus]